MKETQKAKNIVSEKIVVSDSQNVIAGNNNHVTIINNYSDFSRDEKEIIDYFRKLSLHGKYKVMKLILDLSKAEEQAKLTCYKTDNF